MSALSSMPATPRAIFSTHCLASNKNMRQTITESNKSVSLLDVWRGGASDVKSKSGHKFSRIFNHFETYFKHHVHQKVGPFTFSNDCDFRSILDLRWPYLAICSSSTSSGVQAKLCSESFAFKSSLWKLVRESSTFILASDPSSWSFECTHPFHSTFIHRIIVEMAESIQIPIGGTIVSHQWYQTT